MFDREPDYVILSGGGSIADLSGLDIEDPDGVVKDWLEKLTKKEKRQMDIHVETSKSAYNGTWWWSVSVDGSFLALGSGELTEADAKEMAVSEVFRAL